MAQSAEKKLPIKGGEVFKIRDRTAFLILPEKGKADDLIPWVWYAPTLEGLPGQEETWMFEQFLANGMSKEQLTANLVEHNPIDRLASLAKAMVPIFHIHGDSDKVVPLDRNSAVVKERYKQLGGKMTLEVVKGQGHNMWPGWFNSQKLVDFVITHARKQNEIDQVKEQLLDSEAELSNLDSYIEKSIPSQILTYKTPSETVILQEKHLYVFNGNTSVGLTPDHLGFHRIVAPPYFAFPFEADTLEYAIYKGFRRYK